MIPIGPLFRLQYNFIKLKLGESQLKGVRECRNFCVALECVLLVHRNLLDCRWGHFKQYRRVIMEKILGSPISPICFTPADRWNWSKWGLKERKWKGSFLDWFVGLFLSVQEITKDFYPALAALVGPVQNIFPYYFFNKFVPIAQQAGLAVVQGRLSLNVCLWFFLPQP